MKEYRIVYHNESFDIELIKRENNAIVGKFTDTMEMLRYCTKIGYEPVVEDVVLER
jgi:hypothetical protein